MRPPAPSVLGVWFMNYICRRVHTESRQCAKPFLQSLELGLPQPLTRTRVCPPPFGSGVGAHSLAREEVGESQFRRGDVHCGTLYIYVLCGSTTLKYSIHTSFGDVSNVHPLLLGHEAEEGEDDDTGKHGGTRVHATDYQSVLKIRMSSLHGQDFLIYM